MPMRAYPALLAVSATATAACLSVMAGWQRGGLFAERVLWIAVGVVLVVAKFVHEERVAGAAAKLEKDVTTDPPPSSAHLRFCSCPAR
ncbi:L-asparagine transporter-like permease [Paraburkholderia youngii]